MDIVQVSVDPAHLDDDIGHYQRHRDGDSSKQDKDRGEGRVGLAADSLGTKVLT